MTKPPLGPGERRNPAFNRDDHNRSSYSEIRATVDHAKVMMSRQPHDSKIPAPLRDFLMYSFLAETGLKPSETIIFTKHSDNGDEYWGFEPKTIDNTSINAIIQNQAERIVKKDAEITTLKNTLAAATEELHELRRRR